ncbi:MAG: magnesium transporter CorA family protein [Rhizobiales bacterium]|nr:magnesium transporter CorA family protein [Hyphomicrobiales bacterium]
MIKLFRVAEGRLEQVVCADAQQARGATWIDLVEPTAEERREIEDLIGVELPSHQDMLEIEASSRLFVADQAVFLTTPVLAQAETATPVVGPLTFVLTETALITIRYIHPRSIDLFVTRAERRPEACATALDAFVGLVDTLVDRSADVLEAVAVRIDALSRDVFVNGAGDRRAQPDLQQIVQAVGRAGDLISKSRDSLAGFARIIPFLSVSHINLNHEQKALLKIATRDIHSLTDHAEFQTQRATFLLNASLGLIDHAQNDIVKSLTVAATAFLPPTLIASIYGMNFALMPELSWRLGYPLALVLMVLSAVVPLWYFRRRGWL